MQPINGNRAFVIGGATRYYYGTSTSNRSRLDISYGEFGFANTSNYDILGKAYLGYIESENDGNYYNNSWPSPTNNGHTYHYLRNYILQNSSKNNITLSRTMTMFISAREKGGRTYLWSNDDISSTTFCIGIRPPSLLKNQTSTNNSKAYSFYSASPANTHYFHNGIITVFIPVIQISM